MRTHRFDLLSFVFGALFAAVGALGLTDVAVISLADLRWLGPGVLVLVGVALVVSAARRDGSPAVAVEADDRDDADEAEV
ncbi:MAG: hypothetical protein WD225_05405 [Ilumatobacteraceae bacterium]